MRSSPSSGMLHHFLRGALLLLPVLFPVVDSLKAETFMKIHIKILAIVLVCSLVSETLSVPYIAGKAKLSESQIEAIEEQARGRYSDALPLIPVFVRVDRVEGEQIFYTVFYFPFGTVGMSYLAGEGYNIEKPLTGL